MPESLRIAFLSEHASPLATLGSEDAGGQNVYVDEMSRNLAKLGHQVDVFTRRDRSELPDVVQRDDGVRVVHLDAGPPRFLLKDELWPHMAAFRDSLLQFDAGQDRYHVIHGNFWMSGWVAIELKRKLGIPVVQIFHAMGKTKHRHQQAADTSPDERIERELEVVREADKLIAQCPSERDELIEDYGAGDDRVSVIPSAVNIRLFRPEPREAARQALGLPLGDPLIVYVGRMLPRKDVRNVVRAMALLVRRSELPVRLLVVGGTTDCPDEAATPEIGELRRLAASLGIERRVSFVGKRQQDELYRYYCAGDVAVTTPWYEPFGLTPLEAMACGRPVIGSAVGGISFTVDHGTSGFLVPPRDPMALAERLHFLLTRPGLMQSMGRAARQRVEQRFTWPLVALRSEGLYRSVLAEHQEAVGAWR
ncbi:MAG: glycosyltransferase [Chloroflexota bacterium]